MKAKILGIQNVDYVSRKTGNPVVGVTLHTSFSDAQTLGTAVDKIFISDNLHLPCIKDLSIGQIVDIEYNNRGFVCGCEIVNLPSKEPVK